jgi:thiamine biosynthesis lipoprotein
MKKITCLLLVVLLATGCSRGVLEGNRQYSRTNLVAGTFVEIKLYTEEPRNRAEKALDEVFALARALEKKFSIFDPESEINTLNISKEKTVSADLFELIKKAKEISSVTGGEFDITVAPILKKEGFYKDMPDALLERIPDQYKKGAWRDIVLSEDDRTVYLPGGTWLDLSGIAEGYMIDRMSDLLKEKGFNSFMINGGGDIYAGEKLKGGKWTVGLKDPGAEKVLLVLAIEKKAVVTSGDYENWVTDENTGKAISHIVDPSREKNIEKSFSSVTVIAPDCITADALSTGMMAMGPERALELAGSLEGVEVITVIRADGKCSVDFSNGARDYVVWER